MQKEMIRNIIFDIGNVLASFRWQEYYAQFGLEQDIYDRLAKATTLSESWTEYDRGVLSNEEILQKFIANDPELEPVIRKCLTHVQGLVGRYDYAIPWLKELKEQGYGLYYLSNFAERARQDCDDALDFLPYMDGGIFSYEEKVIKPEATIYRLLLERYNLNAEECVFFDDVEKNVLAARETGIHGIVFENKEQAMKELKGLV